MVRPRLLAVLAAWLAVASAANARSILDTVRARGFVQCASIARPGLAERDAKGEWSGLEVEICRAVATAVLGPSARIAYHAYEGETSFDSARDGGDQIAFLDTAEMIDHGLTDTLLPGPTVFVESHDLMVAEDSPVRHPADLARAPVCFIIATPPEDSLDAWFGARGLPLVRYPFREEEEMYDSYAVQRCKAVAGESTALAEARLSGGINHLRSRLLPEPLATVPIAAATPLGGDTRWAAVVGWAIATLRAAQPRETFSRSGALLRLPVEGAGLGLAPDWQKIMLARTGGYGAIFDRTLGAGSPLGLARGPN